MQLFKRKKHLILGLSKLMPRGQSLRSQLVDEENVKKCVLKRQRSEAKDSFIEDSLQSVDYNEEESSTKQPTMKDALHYMKLLKEELAQTPAMNLEFVEIVKRFLDQK